MKTYKKGISLIVLVITIIVLAILATTVIISLSNTNIIEETTKSVFKQDMQSYKEAFELYIASATFDDPAVRNGLNVTSADTAKFTEIFGDKVKDAHKANLEIKNGKLIYKTNNEQEKEILTEVGMAQTVIALSNIAIGDAVEYIPSISATAEVDGVNYVWNEAEYNYNLEQKNIFQMN